MPVPGLYWADAASIGPVQARYWQLMACLQSARQQYDHTIRYLPDNMWHVRNIIITGDKVKYSINLIPAVWYIIYA